MIISAGLLLYRRTHGELQVLLGHLGGPYFARKDAGGWTLPKGELAAGEDPLAAAVREFTEELGSPPPAGTDIALGLIRQSSAKSTWIWAREGDFDPGSISSNTFELEWPPRSGTVRSFPELDRADWFTVEQARGKLVKSLVPVLDLLPDLPVAAR